MLDHGTRGVWRTRALGPVPRGNGGRRRQAQNRPRRVRLHGRQQHRLEPGFRQRPRPRATCEWCGLRFDIFAKGAGSTTDRAYANVAASLQARTNEIVLELARHSRDVTGLDRLCVAGGVAYNAVSIAHLIRNGPFREVYVPPDPGDAGGAVGAALIQAHRAGAAPNRARCTTLISARGRRSAISARCWTRLSLDKVPPPPVEPPGTFRVEASCSALQMRQNWSNRRQRTWRTEGSSAGFRDRRNSARGPWATGRSWRIQAMSMWPGGSAVT